MKEGAPGSPGNLGAGLNANGVRKQRKSNAGALEPGDGDGRTLRATMGSGIKPGRERKKSGRSIKSPAGSRGKDEFERGDSKVSLVDFSTNDSDSDSNSDDYEDVNDATSPKKRGSVVSKTDFNKMAAEDWARRASERPYALSDLAVPEKSAAAYAFFDGLSLAETKHECAAQGLPPSPCRSAPSGTACASAASGSRATACPS